MGVLMSKACLYPAAAPLFDDLLTPLASTLVILLLWTAPQTDSEHRAVWENASLVSPVHHCVLITGQGITETFIHSNDSASAKMAAVLVYIPRLQLLLLLVPGSLWGWLGRAYEGWGLDPITPQKENKGFRWIRALQQTSGWTCWGNIRYMIRTLICTGAQLGVSCWGILTFLWSNP